MAELAIPLLALGSLYIGCNDNNKKSGSGSSSGSDLTANGTNLLKEGMQNYSRGQSGQKRQLLPNTNMSSVNYPVHLPETGDTINNYPNACQDTDKYFDAQGLKQINNDNLTQQQVSTHISLTGEPIIIDEFKHHNMQPFFGAKIHGNAFASDRGDESLLDNLVGTGSQKIRKREQAPLFKPQSSLQYANGTPNTSDFIQSRMLPSMKVNNVKPFSTESVAPGLNKGYGKEGSGGLNSGMESRAAWMPKSVDQMRVATNPKVTYGLANHQGPAKGRDIAPNRQTHGKVEKHSPDTFYINTPDRYFTTGGLEKGQTSRPIEIDRYVNRATTTMQYEGIAGPAEQKGPRINPTYEKPHGQQLPGPQMTNPTLGGKGGNSTFGRDANQTVNNRITTRPAQNLGIATGLVNAIMAPMMDVLKPSRKEFVIGSARPFGNQAPTNNIKPRVFNPADRAPVTTRETTQYSALNMGARAYGGQPTSNGGYRVSNPTAVPNQRDTTNKAYTGTGGKLGGVSNAATYDAAYNMTTSSAREQIDRPNQGGMSMLNSNINQNTYKNDTDRQSVGGWAPMGSSNIPTMQTMGQTNMPADTIQPAQYNRMNPDILTAFKNNPYTQSLSAVA